MPSVTLALALSAAQATAPPPVRCLGVVVPISGLRAADLDDASVAALRRFARARLASAGHRIRYVVFAPYGFDRGTTINREATRLRGEVVRAHLVAAGLPNEWIRVLQLGEQADYAFPAGLGEAERTIRERGGPSGRWTTGASVTAELPAGSDCSRIRRE